MVRKDTVYYAKKAERAAKDAFANLVRERRKTGETLVLWKDGKVVEIPASQIPDSALHSKLTIK